MRKRLLQLPSKLSMENTVISYIVNDKKYIAGMSVTILNVDVDDESLMVSCDNNMEIIYPIDEIVDLHFTEEEQQFTIVNSNGGRFEMTIV